MLSTGHANGWPCRRLTMTPTGHAAADTAPPPGGGLV